MARRPHPPRRSLGLWAAAAAFLAGGVLGAGLGRARSHRAGPPELADDESEFVPVGLGLED